MLAHFTSIDGFKGIIQESGLRMTRSEFMNDPLDSKVLGNMIKKYLNDSDIEKSKLEEIKKEMIDEEQKSYLENVYNRAKVIEYIEFIQKKIPLYVLSFTDKEDEMEFWNYYGNGGVEINFKEEILLEDLRKELKNQDEYFACSPVIYVSKNQTLKEINLKNNLSKYTLIEKNGMPIYDKNKTNTMNSSLYEIDNLQSFVDAFIGDYLIGIKYLIEHNEIGDKNEKKEIMECIFKNQISLTDRMVFRKHFLIYMILLSALIKTNSYEYENETRIIYFENSLENRKREDSYEIKTNFGQKYLRPFIEFKVRNLDQSIDKIIISPLTNNIPIDTELYKRIVTEFIENKYHSDIEVISSCHKCRW